MVTLMWLEVLHCVLRYSRKSLVMKTWWAVVTDCYIITMALLLSV